jgi:hypothetical protein
MIGQLGFAFEEDFGPELIGPFGRIDFFLKQNALEFDADGLCDRFTQIPTVLTPFLDEIQSQVRDLVLVIQTISIGNELLRKRSAFLADEAPPLRRGAGFPAAAETGE